MRRRARLFRYALWQFRDYFLSQGPSTLIVVLLGAYLTLMEINSGAPTGSTHAIVDLSPEAARRFFVQVVGFFVFLGALFATNGIVANDRKFGYYRFYFAKPVSPPAFYGGLFVVNALGFLVVAHLLWLLFRVVVGPMGTRYFTLVVLGVYVGYAGIGFLLSALSRFDWLSLLSVILAAQFAWGVWASATGVRGALVHLLPPVHVTTPVYLAVATGTAMPWGDFAWMAGYGVVCFVLGLVVLRFKSLASNS